LLAAEVGDPLETIAALLPVVRRTYVHDIEQPVDLLWLKVPIAVLC
jgi:hypothetical protein